jgi:hypothetical protein
MASILGLKSILSKDFVVIFFGLLFFISPGIATILVYFPTWFTDLDASRLLLASASLMTPSVTLFWLKILDSESEKDILKMDLDSYSSLFLALFLSALVCYGSLGFAKIFGMVFSNFLWIYIGMCVFAIMLIAIGKRLKWINSGTISL